jgi:hypothetical protein
VTAADRYATPTAFRRALTDRLKSLAGASRWTVPQLQRHVAYDRLLERLYQFHPDWVVKGAAADIGDWFRFDVGAATPVGTVGVRLPVTSVIGTTTWAGFHVDLIGSGLRMTGQPEHVPPLAANAIPEVAQHGYRAYPLVDHVADKIAATYERYGITGCRQPATATSSTSCQSLLAPPLRPQTRSPPWYRSSSAAI